MAFYLGNKFILTGEYKIDPYALFVFFSTLVLYTVHRIYGLNKQKGTLPLRYEWAGKNLNFLYGFVLVSGIASAFFAIHIIQPHSYLLLVFITGISFSYTFPFIPTANGLIRLKDIPFLKPIFISIVVVGVTIILPQYNLHHSFTFFTTHIALVCSAQFFLVLSLTFLFDIRDIDQDKENSIPTLPVAFGVKTTQLISNICVAFYMILFTILFLKNNISVESYYAMLGVGVLTFATILFSEKFKHPIWYMVVADGLMGMQAVLLWMM